MNILDILTYLLIAFFVYVSSWLIHEFMHIKSQGILSTGNIAVWRYSMTVGVSSGYRYPGVFYYAGGVYSSIIMFLLAIVSYGWWQWCWLTMGWLQLCYGFYEGYTDGHVKYRYYIYMLVITVMVILYICKEVIYNG